MANVTVRPQAGRDTTVTIQSQILNTDGTFSPQGSAISYAGSWRDISFTVDTEHADATPADAYVHGNFPTGEDYRFEMKNLLYLNGFNGQVTPFAVNNYIYVAINSSVNTNQVFAFLSISSIEYSQDRNPGISSLSAIAVGQPFSGTF